MRKTATIGTIIASLLAFPVHATDSETATRTTNLRCENVDNGVTLNIKIQGDNIWLEDRLQLSRFSEGMIEFQDENIPEFLLRLDRTNGRLTVYQPDKGSIDSVYNCQVVDRVMF